MIKKSVTQSWLASLFLISLIAVIGYGCVTSSHNANTQALPNQPSDVFNSQTGTVLLGADDTDKFNNEKFNNLAHSSRATNPSLTKETSLPEPTQTNLSAINNPLRLQNSRPDLHHLLLNKFTDPDEQTSALSGAELLQDYLEHPQQDAVTLMRRYDCQVINLTQADQNLIKMLTFDTPERKAVLRQGLQNYQPPVSVEIQIDNNGNAISPCTAINQD